MQVSVFLLPLTRSDATISPSRGEVVGLLLCWLLPKVSIFLPNPAKTRLTAEKAPIIRCSGFAERERDLCLAYFSSFFPLKFVNYYTHSTPASYHKSTGKNKYKNTGRLKTETGLNYI